jgi:4'-phosphopantetheinyl transferase
MEESWQTPSIDLCLTPQKVHIWRVQLDEYQDWNKTFDEILSTEERARADKFRQPIHRIRFRLARGILRILISHYLGKHPGDLKFRYDSYGKPWLHSNDEELNFNISHSHSWGLYAFTYGRKVGIDIERIRPIKDIDTIINSVFSEQEIKAFLHLNRAERLEGFYRCWTRKEAVVKALGKGLSYDIRSFTVSLLLSVPTPLLEDSQDTDLTSHYRLEHLAPTNGYVGALAVEGGDWLLEGWDFPPSWLTF